MHQCQDQNPGTLAWSEKEATCFNTHAEVYSGPAEMHASMTGGSNVMVIGDQAQGSYAGDLFGLYFLQSWCHVQNPGRCCNLTPKKPLCDGEKTFFAGFVLKEETTVCSHRA